MNIRNIACFVCAVLLSVGLSARGAAAQDVVGTIAPGVEAALVTTGEARVIVALSEPTLQGQKGRLKADTSAVVSNMQLAVIADVPASDFKVTHQYASIPALTGVVTSEAALARLAANPYVWKVDLDASGQGGLETLVHGRLAASVEVIGGAAWHDLNVRGAGTTVAVLDSGIDSNHNALGGSLVHEACFFESSAQEETCPDGTDHQVGAGAATDDHGHGTAVTGIIASNGSNAPTGVAPETSIVALKVLNSENRFWISDVLSALDYLQRNPGLNVDVINMSFGTDRLFEEVCDASTSWNWALNSTIATLRNRGLVAVASSMNNGSTTELASPACLSGVVSVGATNIHDNDRLVSFTNRNDDLDVVAPGLGIETTIRGNRTGSFSGTSAAAPHVTGCAALLNEVGDLTASQLEHWLTDSNKQIADPDVDRTFPHLSCFNTEIMDGPLLVNQPDDFDVALGEVPIEINLRNVFFAASDDWPTFTVASSNPLIAEATITNEVLAVEAKGLGAAEVVVEALNASGITSTSFTVDVGRYLVDFRYDFVDPTESANYQLVALPGQLDQDLAATLSGNPGTTWRAFRETGADGEDSEDYLVEYDGSEAFRFAPGRGFWLLSQRAWVVDATVDAVGLTEEGTIMVPLQEGWNILSNPLDQAVDWEATLSLAANEPLAEGLWKWNGSWAEADSLRSARKGKAYYLFNDSGLRQLTLQHPAVAAEEDGALLAGATAEAKTLRLLASLEMSEDALHSLGQVTLGYAEARQARRVPPAHFAPGKFYTQAADTATPLGRLLQSARRTTAGYVFELTLEAEAGSVAHLSAVGLETFDGEEVVLVTPGGQRHNLSLLGNGDTVRYRLDTDTVQLQLLIGSTAFVDAVAERPETLALGPVYPNPSSREVRVDLAVPTEMDLRVELFNVLGQQVGLLHVGELSAGVHTLRWNGRLSSGAVAASGVYLLRVTGRDGPYDTTLLTRVR